MRSTNNKLLVSVCTSLLLIFLLFFFPLIDSGIVGGISNLRSDGLDQVMGWITNIGSGIVTFFALPVIDREFPRIKIFWIVFALLIIFSRLYFGVHFLSDVVAGALLGYLSGFLFVRTWENHVWKGNKKMGVRAHGRK